MDKTKNTGQKFIRHFSEEFKRQKVKELDAKVLSISDIVRLYEVSSVSVCRWRKKYSVHYQQATRVVVEMESEAQKTKELLARNAELERIVGQKQMSIDFLEKLLEIASKELKMDIKKSFSIPP
ncbi:transposase [Arcicella aurantiaca]|uniref:Transposase n=1 Tax=Arcicella aurantiaca TaxID=591202 RepID=A0A316EYW1_9BACT|nr:transposase [Arcicella aurantiaca]PWK28455.1 transposase [Arcicella aurantiaca]